MVVANAGYQGKRRSCEQLAGNGRANAAGQGGSALAVASQAVAGRAPPMSPPLPASVFP